MQQPKPYYPLKEVKALVKDGKWRVNGNARESAREDFGWGVLEIQSAILALRPCDFDISDWSKHKPGVMVDAYKAANLKGEAVYTHFYIDEETVFVIINSFKRLTGPGKKR
jgi:hypothetical protein